MGDVDIPTSFGWVAVVVALAALQHMWMWYEVIRARIRYGVKPPTVYADDGTDNGKHFNCVQRAYQNCVEIMPVFLTLLILGGFQHPRLNAALGVAYIIARFVYFSGYTSGDPSGRMRGMMWVGVIFFMCATTLSFGVQTLLIPVD